MPGRLYRSLPRHFLLFHPLIFPWILLESRQKYAISLRFLRSFLPRKRKKKKKTMQQRCIEYRMLELLFVLPILSFFQRFDKNFITRSETKRWKNEICQFFLPLFFPPFSINFNSSFQKHLPYVIASNVWNYRMFADARANWNTELRKWIKKSVFPPDISYLTRFKFSINTQILDLIIISFKSQAEI